MRSEFGTASSIFVVAENTLFFITSLKISSYPGSSSKGNVPELIVLTKFSFISTPIVGNPDFANERAVGSPILPIPTTQTWSVREFNDYLTSSRLFILSFESDIDITSTDLFEHILTYYNFVMIAIRPKF